MTLGGFDGVGVTAAFSRARCGVRSDILVVQVDVVKAPSFDRLHQHWGGAMGCKPDEFNFASGLILCQNI